MRPAGRRVHPRIRFQDLDAVGSERVQAALEVLAGGDAADATPVAEEATFESDVRAILAEA